MPDLELLYRSLLVNRESLAWTCNEVHSKILESSLDPCRQQTASDEDERE